MALDTPAIVTGERRMRFADARTTAGEPESTVCMEGGGITTPVYVTPSRVVWIRFLDSLPMP